jgi:hypothetical protein
MLLKKTSAFIFLLIFALSSFNPSFAGPPEDESQKQGISKRKLSDQEEKKEDLSHTQHRRDKEDIGDEPAPNFWDPISRETLLQAPWPYVCLYISYNLCCGCFRAGL